MSEYWKSTPKYWCKHCKTYVRDTKLERTQHDATGRHQGNLKRFLRDLHRDHEKEEREKGRAKHEVERLNGLVSGSPSTPSGGLPSSGTIGAPSRQRHPTSTGAARPRQATAEERKKQMAQLAEMGVAVPEDFRGQMAMAGEWQTVSETPVWSVKKEEEESKEGILNPQRRKRRGSRDDDEDEEEREVRKKGWGSSIKSYPGFQHEDDELEALLKSGKPGDQSQGANEIEIGCEVAQSSVLTNPADGNQNMPAIKRESSDEQVIKPIIAATEAPDVQNLKKEESNAGPEQVIFKKRKVKHIRQK